MDIRGLFQSSIVHRHADQIRTQATDDGSERPLILQNQNRLPVTILCRHTLETAKREAMVAMMLSVQNVLVNYA